MWIGLTVVALVALGLYWRGPNAVWGGLMIGAFVGVAVALVARFRGETFGWMTVSKGAIVGVLIGVAGDLIGRWSDRLRATS